MKKVISIFAACITMLLSAVILAAPIFTAPAAQACSNSATDHIYINPPGVSKIWLTNAQSCHSGYPIFYNRSACTYRNVIGTFWYDGATRRGNGSISSNYSQVSCTQFPFGVITQSWLWINFGIGWQSKRLF